MSIILRFLSFAGLGILLLFLGLLLDVFIIRPSAVYSVTDGESFGFCMGLEKDETIMEINNQLITQVRSRSPFSMQHNPGNIELTDELERSDYWILFGNHEHILLFQDGKLSRIITHVRRLGELEGSGRLFWAQNPLFPDKNPEEIGEEAIKFLAELGENNPEFDGLTTYEIGEIIIRRDNLGSLDVFKNLSAKEVDKILFDEINYAPLYFDGKKVNPQGKELSSNGS